MATQVSLQDVLSAVGGPLQEISLWALLHQAHATLKKAVQEYASSGKEPALLITPESMLLNHGGHINFLPGIARSSSSYSAPELCQSCSAIDLEKCYVYSLGICLTSAMKNELQEQMIPQVSEIQHKLLTHMTAYDSEQRPSLEDIFSECSRYYKSPNHASEEVDKLVSYVLGSTLDFSSDSEDCKIEADLEAEIQQVMDIKGARSIENLYPPSYGSRESSSLSLGSSGCQRNFTVNTPKINSGENMYSSLPMIFPATVQDQSDDHLTAVYHQNAKDEKRKTTALYRSSSDGKKKYVSSSCTNSNVPTNIQFDDMPPLQPKLVDLPLSSEVPTYGETPNQNVPTSVSNSSSEQEISGNQDVAPMSTTLDSGENNMSSEEFNFPSPPPVPLTLFSAKSDKKSAEFIQEKDASIPKTNASCSTPELIAETLENCSSAYENIVSEVEEKRVPQEDATKSFPENKEMNSLSMQPHSDLSGDKKMDSERLLEEITPADQSKVVHTKSSLKKLSNMFGPEFVIMSGQQTDRRVVINVPIDRRQIEVVMLNGCTISFVVELKSTCRELFNQVIAHQSLKETHIFGLAAVRDQGELFLEFDRKLVKYAPKGWASKNIPPALKMGKKLFTKFTVFFRVKYYPENVNHLRLSQTRHLYYLQLRKDILEDRTYCHEQSAIKLAAYSLQAEKGDSGITDWKIEDFLPLKVINKLGRPVIHKILPGMHSELKGQCREVAEFHYLREAQTLPEYGMVFYEVSKEKHGMIGSVWLGLSVRGIVVYNVHKGVKTPNSHWPWKKMKNLSFVNQKFVIELEDKKTFSFYTDSRKKAQYLLHLSINYHRFQLLPRGPAEYSSVTTAHVEQPRQELSDWIEIGDIHSQLTNSEQLPEGSTFPMEVTKDGSIGLQLADGINNKTHRGFVYVQSINKGAIASTKGEIEEDDILLKVNEQSIYGMTSTEATALILSSTLSLSLWIHRPYKKQWLEYSKTRQL